MQCGTDDDIIEGMIVCASIYKNPDGSPEKYNEFIGMDDATMSFFSVID